MKQGGSGGGIGAIEKIEAPNANTSFYFGNHIINSRTDALKQVLKGPWRDYGELTIDTKTLTENGHELLLDFSGVSREMEFVFEDLQQSKKLDIEKIFQNISIHEYKS